MVSNFPSNWRLFPLEDCMDAIIDYRGKTPQKTTSGIPLITAKIVKGGRIQSVEEFISPDHYDDWMRRGLPKPGDILMTTEAPLGEIAQLDNRKVALAQRLITLRGKKGFLDNNYLKFLLQSDFVQNQLAARATGTTVLGIKQSELRKVSLVVPPLDEQKAIAHILGTLDDKIELNQQMNRTLEDIARALFKSWFIDFDPVRAKLDGRQPAGMDAETAALFPAEFEDSVIGQIPKGWEVKTLGDFIDIKHGYAFKGEFFRDQPPGDILLTPGNFAIGGGFKDDKFKYYVGEVPEEFVLAKGDLLVTMTDLSKLGDTLGFPAILPTEREGRYLHNQRLGKVLIKSENTISKLHLYYLLCTNEYRHEILAGATGTTVKHTSPGRIQAFKLFAPPAKLSLKFDAMVDSLFEKMSLNNDESQSLTVARDALLPKLLSGEIRVKEAEKIVAEVA